MQMITAKYLVNPYEELPFAYLFKIIWQVAAKMFVVIRIYFGFSPSPLTKYILFILGFQRREISLIGGGTQKVTVKSAWEAIATPNVLEHLNWEGPKRKDRDPKIGVKDFAITKSIYSSVFCFVRSPVSTPCPLPGTF